MNFTDEQNKAITITDGIICLSAGPGCGKTTVLINKFFYILEKLINEKSFDQKTAISSILALTFTNKATDEIKIRLKSLLKTKLKLPSDEINKILNFAKIYTIDAFASNFIKENIIYTNINLSNDFEIINSTSARDLFLKIGYEILDSDAKYINILENLGLHKSPSQILKSAYILIENLLSRLISPENFFETSIKSYHNNNTDKETLALAEFFKILYEKFNKTLEEKNSLIFPNLLTYAYKIIKEYPNILINYIKKENLEYILIDEYQDVNDAEDLFLREISKFIKNYKSFALENYFLVGDTGQSIYMFRNANYHLMLEYKSLAKSNYFLNLSQNFRSTKTIINFINQYFLSENNNIYQKLIGMRNEIGENVKIFLASDYTMDAEFIAKKIKYLILEKNYNLKDIKILFRSKTKIPIYAKTLEKFSIPFRVNDPIMFTKSLEIKIFLSIMRFLLNPRDDEAVFLILTKIFNFSENEIIIIKNLDDFDEFKPKIKLYLQNFSDLKKNYKYISLFENISVLEKINFLNFIKMKKLEQLYCSLSFFENLNKKIKSFISFSKKIFKIFNQNRILESFNKILETEEIKNLIKTLDINFIQDFQILLKLYEKKDLFGNILGFLKFFDEMEENDFKVLEKETENDQKVELLTIHKSKGLEFKVVFLAGTTNISNRQNVFHFHEKYGLIIKYNEKKEILKNGNVNFYQKFLEENLETEHLKEEERIFYVGLTRSQDLLFISFIKQNNSFPKLSNKILEIKGETYLIKENFKPFVKFAKGDFSTNENLKIKDQTPLKIDFYRENVKISMKNYLEKNEIKIFQKQEKVFYSVAELELFRKCPFIYFLEKQKKIGFLYNEENENIILGNIFHEFLFENFYQKYDEKFYKKILVKKFKLKNFILDEKIENMIDNFINWMKNKDFNEILFVEKNFAWKINNFLVRGTIDRIDKSHDNEIIIFDYKTSFNSKNSKEYLLSMNIYMHAMEEIYNFKVKNIKLLYPFVNEEIPLEKMKKNELKSIITDYVKNIRIENFKKIENENCKKCSYQNFCKTFNKDENIR